MAALTKTNYFRLMSDNKFSLQLAQKYICVLTFIDSTPYCDCKLNLFRLIFHFTAQVHLVLFLEERGSTLFSHPRNSHLEGGGMVDTFEQVKNLATTLSQGHAS